MMRFIDTVAGLYGLIAALWVGFALRAWRAGPWIEFDQRQREVLERWTLPLILSIAWGVTRALAVL